MHLECLIGLMEKVAVAGRPVSVAAVQKAAGLSKLNYYQFIKSL